MLQSASLKRMVASDSPTIQPARLQGKAVLYTANGEGQERAPSLIDRASKAASELLGETYGELIYSVLRGCKQGQIGLYLARIILERSLPETRPTPVTLPLIDCAADLVEADRRLMAAANAGTISHREWRSGQECILASWEIRKQARLEEP